MIGIFNTIKINNVEIFRPNDFEIIREDVYAAEYTTCTGKTIADRIGWKYADMELSWDMLTDQMLSTLSSMTVGTLKFTDSDGEHTENIMRLGFNNTPTRFTKNGVPIWKNVSVNVRFLDVHTDGESESS